MTRIIPILLSLLLLIACAPAQQHAIGSQALTVSDVLNAATSTEGPAVLPSEPPEQPYLEDDFENFEEPSPTAAPLPAEYPVINIDLTAMNATMVYSQVYDMISHPENYVGTVVRMKGILDVFETETRNYYACIIADATACCAQGIEFVLAGERRYPDDYPAVYGELTVTGVFGTYEESGYTYLQLIDAVMSF